MRIKRRLIIAEFVIKTGTKASLRLLDPHDKQNLKKLYSNLSPESHKHRFFTSQHKVLDEIVENSINYSIEEDFALACEIMVQKQKKLAGVIHILKDKTYKDHSELAIVVSDFWQRQGIGTHLTQKALDIAGKKNIKKIYAFVLKENYAMLALIQKFNFKVLMHEDDCHKVELELDSD